MARFISDQNQVILKYESGTYGATSGNAFWIGQVTENSVTDNEAKIIDRFTGTLNRSFDVVDLGPTEYGGTITYNAQDMKIPFLAIGSVQDITGTATAKIHYVNLINNGVWLSPFISGTNQLNSPTSLTLEDSKTSAGTGNNFIRTIKGVVPSSVRVIAAQGEKVKIECDYVAQNISFTSGAISTTTQATNTAYLWNNCTLTISGNSIKTAKEVTLEVNNNAEAPHYVNGSRVADVPILGNRDIMLNVTLDLNAPESVVLYESLYKNNGVFNAVFDLNADRTTGSQHTIFFLSGCNIISMENPSTFEGPVESSVEIQAKAIIGSAIDTIAYLPW